MGGLFFTLDIAAVCHSVYVTYPPNPLSVKGALVTSFLIISRVIWASNRLPINRKRVLTFVSHPLLLIKKLYNKSYFEAGRRPRKRSLLDVNEHFEDKPDAERALLGSFFYLKF